MDEYPDHADVERIFMRREEPSTQPWLTAREAAEVAGVHERTIRRAIARGELHATRQSGQFRIAPVALQTYLRPLRAHDPSPPGTARPHRLSALGTVPVPPTALIGRDRELDLATSILASPDGRLLTLTGPGGVGKTRLALAIAIAVAPRLADGVVFVPLETVRDPDLIVQTIAQRLGLVPVEGQSLLQSLTEALRARQQLLVLDNFEHLLTAATLVADLLAADPGLRVLVTSREALRLRGETELVVPPLALPNLAQAASAEAIGQAPAVELFVRRARAVHPDFTLTAAIAPVVGEICQRLDGLPLAIELAAARTKHTPPPALLARLDRRLDLLSDGAHDLPQRLRTMRAAIAWSYALLTPEDQALLRRLSLFVGGFTAEAAAWLAASAPDVRTGPRPADILPRLTSLIDKSLLPAPSSAGVPRYAMLETIREFALEQLLASGEAAETAACHAAYFLSLAEEVIPEFHHATEAVALDRIEAELGNFRAALTWAVGEPGDTGRALRLGNALFWLWYVRGYHPEGWQWFQAVIARPDAEHWPEPLADATIHAGWLALRMGISDEADRLMSDALRRCSDLQMARSTAFARGSCGFVALVGFGDPVRAASFMEAGRLEAQAVGDGWLEAMACYGLSIVSLATGDIAAAQSWGERSLAISRQDGDMQGIAASLANLGQLARLQERPDLAAQHFAEALEHYQRVGDRGNVCTCVESLAGLQISRGKPEQGALLFGAAAALRHAIGTPVQGHEQARYDADVAVARTALPEAVFAAAWSAGEATSLQDALSGVAWSTPFDHFDGPPAAGGQREATLAALTRREREVLDLIGAGHTDRQIGQILSISPATVTKHVSNVLGKLGVHSRTAAAILLMTAGL